MVYQDSSRPLRLQTPLGKDAIQLIRFSGVEEISQIFQFDLDLISKQTAINPVDIIGKNITFSIAVDADNQRYFNGFVQRFIGGDQDPEGARSYSARVVPWLWFLTQRSDCRIFQNMTVVQVIEEVFQNLGFNDFETSQLEGEHPEREYWVQYRESDFNFVSRLMEEEGIFYFFRHEEGKHTLVLADSRAGYDQCTEYEVDCPLHQQTREGDKPHIHHWQHHYEYRSGGWEHTDYNFTTPGLDFRSGENTLMKFETVEQYQRYEYPGKFADKGFGKSLSRLRMEEIESDHDVVAGGSGCRTFSAGHRFQVGKHRTEAEKEKEYVLRRVLHTAGGGSYQVGGTGDEFEYSNSFECFPSQQTFRPARNTAKPVIYGCQTAVVTGPAGEEIYVDEYGRVKVQFHWDRLGRKDENTTLWIRCKQSIAGNQWGFMAIPRIGQEVVVEFLEGDPDRPLITGCVYNAAQMPHYKLPDEKAKTYIKTNSTKGGDGHNELMFDDLADNERIYIHAQKNMDVRVLNDSKELVLNDRHLIVGQQANGQKSGNQIELVYGNKHQSVKGSQDSVVEGNVKLHIGGDSSGGDWDITVDGDQKAKVGGDANLDVSGDHAQKVGGKVSTSAGGAYHLKAGSELALDAGQEVHIKAGMKLIIEAGAQLSLKAAGSFIDIGPAGVAIQGTMVNINSGGSAGSGGGCSPSDPAEPTAASPDQPAEAHTSTTGMKSSS